MRMVGSLLFGIGVVRIAGFAIYFSYLSLACVAGLCSSRVRFGGVMKQECSVIVRWRDFIIPLILLLIVSLVCQSDRELDDRSH